MSSLDGLQSDLAELGQLIAKLRECAPGALTGAIDGLQRDAAAFSPRIAIVGQVKAGKTALLNALLGMPDFLPSDVNPWTSAITSVHLNRAPADGNRAVFHFFDEETWAWMTEEGGRLGELAARWNADAEGDLLATQVSDLKRRTAKRLGRNYLLLLGRSHRFADATPDLVRRYVCLGDEVDTQESREGRFADLTRAADLYVAAPEYSIPLTLEDTPGVNDPFLVREHMTLAALDKSQICVLVLSAYQAMTTVDLGLVRLLRTLRSDRVIIFVNRIDELSDRAADLPRIEAMLRGTLSEQGMARDIRIVFGSAEWARKAAVGTLDNLSAEDIATATEGASGADPNRRAVLDRLRDLSGILDLKAAIADMIASSVGVQAIAEIRRRARDLVEQSKFHLQTADRTAADVSEYDISDRLDLIVENAEHGFNVAMQSANGAVEALNGTSVSRWIAAQSPAVGAGEDTADPSALQSSLITAYEDIAAEARTCLDAVMAEAEAALRDVYRLLLPSGADVFPIFRSEPPEFPRPTALAQSTAFDLRGGWTDVLRSASKRSELRESRFREIAEREFRTMLSNVADTSITEGVSGAKRALHGFLMPHILNIQALAAVEGREGQREALLDGHTERLMGRFENIAARIDRIELAGAVPVPLRSEVCK